MPRSAVATSPGVIEIVDLAETPLADGQVRVRSAFAAAKHGTEMSFTLKTYATDRGGWDNDLRVVRPDEPSFFGSWPMGIGNMIVGEVVESRSDFAVGTRVCAHAGFTESAVVAVGRCRVMPEAMPWQSAVCHDPAQFALGAVRDGNVRVGDAVAVFGLGAIGLMVVAMAKLAGASVVIACDPMANRRQVAETLGADLTIDPSASDAGVEIKLATGNRGADVVIDYSGNVHALQAALRGVAFGGTVVCGAYPPPYGAGLDLGAEAHMNRPQIVFSRAESDPNRDHPRWSNARILEETWRLLATGALTGVGVVDPIVSFDAIPVEYPKIATDPGANIKLGVAF